MTFVCTIEHNAFSACCMMTCVINEFKITTVLPYGADIDLDFPFPLLRFEFVSETVFMWGIPPLSDTTAHNVAWARLNTLPCVPSISFNT